MSTPEPGSSREPGVGRAGSPAITLSTSDQTWSFDGDTVVRVGRDPVTDVSIDDELVSRMHLELRATAAQWTVLDTASTNGSFVAGRRVSRVDLAPGDRATICLGSPAGVALTVAVATLPGRAHTVVPARRDLIIGREPGVDIFVDDPLVSRRHALLRFVASGPQLHDLESFNGTWVNDRRIGQPTPLSAGDRLQIGVTILDFDGVSVVPAPRAAPSGGLQARHLTVVTVSGKVLLEDVSLRIPASALVAIIGPSGAGKSTLLGALTGLVPASVGRVTWSGRDLYANYDELRARVGLVPQEDILHSQLTVIRALRFAAQLRFPPDTSGPERDRRIQDVLREVGLEGQANQRIDSLSGGQRKRTSIALELLTAPPLLFLDEPTSGLDPGLDLQVMTGLRSLANGGRIVVVVTHSVLALDKCDLVLLMAPGGRVAYYGPPSELLPYFGAANYPAVFANLDSQQAPDRYAASSLAQEYVGETGLVPPPNALGPPPPPSTPHPWMQLATLSARTLAVTVADRMLIGLLIGMPLLLALMSRAVPGSAGLSMDASNGVVTEATTRLIVLIIGACLMGSALTCRELVRERAIFRRERAVGLSTAAYLASKAGVFAVLVIAQGVVFVALALLGLPAPDSATTVGASTLEIMVAVSGTAVALCWVGLAISAWCTSAEQTMPALVAVVMAQLVLCGGILPLAGRPILQGAASLVPARFGFAAAGSTTDLNTSLNPTPDGLFDPTQAQWLANLLALALLAAAALGLAYAGLRHSVRRRGPR